MTPRDLEIGDVVQIDPKHADKRFAACMMVVTEPKAWGAQGVIVGPMENEAGQFYYRVKFEACEFVGRAVWVRSPK